jgi:hypothetical protein
MLVLCDKGAVKLVGKCRAPITSHFLLHGFVPCTRLGRKRSEDENGMDAGN